MCLQGLPFALTEATFSIYMYILLYVLQNTIMSLIMLYFCIILYIIIGLLLSRNLFQIFCHYKDQYSQRVSMDTVGSCQPFPWTDQDDATLVNTIPPD